MTSRDANSVFDCAFLYALAGAGQALVLWLAVVDDLEILTGLGYWLAFISLIAVVLRLLVPFFETHHIMALLLIGLGGPLGAGLAIMFCARFAGQQPAAPPDLLEWFDTLGGRGSAFTVDHTDTEMEEDESDLALLNPGAPTLEDVVQSGTLGQKRNAIARMAAAYHRDYFPLLETALADPEPTVRVQAAAVLTGLGQERRDRLEALVAAATDAKEEKFLELAEAIGDHLTSRLLDADGARVAVRALIPLVAHLIEQGTREEKGRLRLHLVWWTHAISQNEGIVLISLLQKLVADQQLEQAS